MPYFGCACSCFSLCMRELELEVKRASFVVLGTSVSLGHPFIVELCPIARSV